MKCVHRAALAFSLFVSLTTVRADSTNLLPVADTTLLEAYPTNNLGGGGTLVIGKGPRGRGRGLLKFDVSGLPADVTVTSASLSFNVVAKHAPNSVASTFSLHRMLKDWGEGDKIPNTGDTATQGESSWLDRFFPTDLWSAPGAEGDFVTASSGGVFVDDLGPYTAVGTGLAADVQFWLNNPASNFGWMLKSDDEATDYTMRRIVSRESLSGQPALALEYQVLPNISNVSLVANKIHFSFKAQTNKTYAVEFRGAVDTGSWSTLTNVPALPAASIIEVSDTASESNRFYRIRTP